jgi:hypothetical protein
MHCPRSHRGHLDSGDARIVVPEQSATRTARAPLAGRMLTVQRTAGNRAVGRLLQRSPPTTPPPTQEEPADGIGPVDFDSIVEDYPIVPADENDLDREVEHSADFSATGVKVEHRDTGRRLLSKDGLRDYLSTLAHGPLSPFEEQLVADWGRDPMDKLTPLLRIGQTGVFGYMLDSGGSGDVLRTVYARDGTVVHTHHSETPLVNMGLGPVEWIMLGTAVLALGKLALRAVASRVVTGEAAAVAAQPTVFLNEKDAVFAEVENGAVVRYSNTTGSSHEVWSGYTSETVPPGVEIVTVIKEEGQIHPILSKGIHGRAMPASQAAYDAVRALFY